ncbi:MAG: hypothetical protein JW827_07295 [Spirochaetes bacterium]|nr:hypothetical protein [Spirochaetota bacterium]
MKKYIVGILIFILLIPSARAEMIRGAKSLALGGVQSAVTEDPNAVFNNAASLFSISKYSLLLSYMPIYSIDNFYYLRGTAIIPYRAFRFGAGLYNITAEDLYAHTLFVLSLSYSFSRNLHAGLSFKYILDTLEKEADEVDSINDRINHFSFDFGLIFYLNKFFLVGLSGKNLNNPRLAFSKETIITKNTTSFELGSKINVIRDFSIFIEEEFIKGLEPLTKIGSEFIFYRTVAVRAGMGKNETANLGIGLAFPYMRIDFGLMAHSDLGNQYQLDITFEL